MGTYITIVTIIFSFKQLNRMNFEINEMTPHVFFSLAVLALVIPSYLSGVASGIIGNFSIGYKPWNHHNELFVKFFKAHAMIARVNVIGGYIACTTGLIVYQNIYN